ncbi:MAG: hypothetical protein K0S04_2344 [Herbinix sp.]|nr:hypothetical protein [Herbinix sp.]
MKKLKKFGIVLFLIIFVSLLGCAEKEKFSVGTWNENTFENSWLDMRFQINDNWSIASDEEISTRMGVGAEYLSILNGSNKEALEAAAKLTSIYGFMIYKTDLSTTINLIYENLTKSVGGTKLDERSYLDYIKKQLPSKQYKLIDESTTKIAGKTFYTTEFSLNNGVSNLSLKYITYKLDDYMVSLVISSTPDGEKEVEEFLNNITTLDEKVNVKPMQADKATVTPEPTLSPEPTISVEPDFRKVKWGMTKEEVIDIEGTSIIEQSEDYILYNVEVMGLDMYLAYYFNEKDQVCAATYMSKEKHTNQNDYILEYNQLIDALTEKYGEPYEDETIWKSDRYKGDSSYWGFAISAGDLVDYASWDANNTNIKIIIDGDNFTIHIRIFYTSKTIEAPESDATSGL